MDPPPMNEDQAVPTAEVMDTSEKQSNDEQLRTVLDETSTLLGLPEPNQQEAPEASSLDKCNSPSETQQKPEGERLAATKPDVSTASTNIKFVQIAQASVQFSSSHQEQYLKGCKWAPDGTCILTNNSDNALRIYNLPSFLYEQSSILPSEPELVPQAVVIKEGGLILDYCWYPQMSSMDAATCCLLSCSSKCPVHLWDAFDGRLRASYNPINRVDEVEGCYSLAFSADGQKFYCGSKNFVRVFDLCRPGRDCETRELKHHKTPAEYRQPGIVSAIAVNYENPKLYAVGSYRKSVGLYSEPDGRFVSLLHGHKGGITQLSFSADGLKLFSGARSDNEIICWDIRSPGCILAILQRNVATSQRVQFDLNPDGLLYSGNTNGLVTVYDVNQASGETCPVGVKRSWKASGDCINGVSLHPTLPIVATASGQRHFVAFEKDDDDEEEEEGEKEEIECCLKMWWLTEDKSFCDNNL
ncbi:telomerase Cajal body protein 1 [Neocloeon triangulifer]|uniref:telomerase Cajal body protein 1 n=1 Tax=Neocloeon triangulifer TaxID=2078957 RepID=UPI00286EB4B6|nr:telomerase Cajal body protein 1 [Neocloeon triangulifer]